MKKSLLLSAALVAAMSANAGYFVVGANVDGAQDWDGTAEHELVAQGNGVYKWEGTELGTGFKINGGAGDWTSCNIGSNGQEVEEGVPYYYANDSMSGNINLFESTVVKNPILTLYENGLEGDETMTPCFVLEGDFQGKVCWFLTGVNDNWTVAEGDDAYQFIQSEDDEDIYTVKDLAVTLEEGALAVAQTGWAHKFGTNDPELKVSNSNLNITLEEVGGEAGNVPYILTAGTYSFELNLADAEHPVLVITAGEGDTAVEGVEVDEAEAVYYTLDGVKVEKPVAGVYVKVAGKKASKVLVAE